MMQFDTEEKIAVALRQAWDADTPAPDAWDVDAALARVRGRRLTSGALELHSARDVRGRRIAALIAASIIATVGIGLVALRLEVIHLSFLLKSRDSVLEAWKFMQQDSVELNSIIVTPSGERRTVRLPDGTGVTVGPGSRLEMMAFAASARTVSLDGDAYFRVAPDSTRPFSVIAGQAVVRVVGTEFAVGAYAKNSTTRVAVVEGRVTVSPNVAAAPARSAAVLSAGDLGTLTIPPGSASLSVTKISGGDLSSVVGWTRGELAFAETPLREVAGRLERWYGVTITVDPALADRRVTASFTNRPLADVLAGICGALRAQCSQDGARVTMASAAR